MFICWYKKLLYSPSKDWLYSAKGFHFKICKFYIVCARTDEGESTVKEI